MKKHFSLIHEKIQSTKRIGIEHLEKLKPLDFISLVKLLQSEGSKITDKTAETSIKVDGFGLRFGLDNKNKFFIESSNSGPQFKSGAFSEYSKNKRGEADTISVAYDTIFSDLKKNKSLQKILKDNNTESGIKVVTECLYTPIGKEDGDKIKFVAINYDKKKLGSTATFVLINVISGDGEQLEKDILSDIKDISTSEFKFDDSKVSIKDIDFNIEISNVLKFVKKYPDLDLIVTSRKKKDKELKELIKSTLISYQERMSKKILKSIKDSKFGDEFEGVVIKLLNGKSFKVIHNDFSSRKNQKYRPK